jgi:hypothetical protein
MERFKKVRGYEYYWVSDLGRVWSSYSGKFLSPRLITSGYLRCALSGNGKVKDWLVHRLVALHFVDGFEDGLDVHHVDENKLNNKSTNLMWVTHQQNMEASHAKKYLVTYPCGKQREVFNLKQFCLKNGLCQGSMSSVARGKTKAHKEFKCKEI